MQHAANIRSFMDNHYRHFNALTTVEAAKGWVSLLDSGGKMFVTLAGAMSTAELGISLSEMIRNDKVHAICSTAANLEEDIFNLVAHERYVRLPNYRTLSPQQEASLRDRGLNRVTDTCIPEAEAMTLVKQHIYKMIRSGALESSYQIDPKNSWVLAASEKDLPIYTPGWEDSTLGNIFVAQQIQGQFNEFNPIKSGLDQMKHLIGWYMEQSAKSPIGFFQIGGGIAGDFSICAVPLIKQDLRQDCPYWAYFCQISDSTTSYGSYSGAVPNEKITWGKLDVDTPRFIIESDATIVAPLIFAYVLG